MTPEIGISLVMVLRKYPYKNNWKWLNVGTVPTFKTHNIGTVPTFKMHNVGTVPTYKMHNVGTTKFYDFF